MQRFYIYTVLLLVGSAGICADGYLQINAMSGTRVFVDGELVGETALAAVPEMTTDEEFVEGAMEEALLGPEEPVEEAAVEDLGFGDGEEDWAGAEEGAEAEAEPEPVAFLVVGPLGVGTHTLRTERTGQPARQQDVEVQAHALTLVVVPDGEAPIEVVEGGIELELPADPAVGTLEVVTLPAETFVQLGDGEPVAKTKPLWTATQVPVGGVTVSAIGADGFVLEHTATLPPGGRVRLIFNLETGDVHNATLAFFAAFWFESTKKKPVKIDDQGTMLWHDDGYWLAQSETSEMAYRAYLKEEKIEIEGAAAGMSRVDAEAYCEWLTEREQKKAVIPSGWGFRLPTREEWTAVAGVEIGEWKDLFGGVAEWTSGETNAWVIAMGGSDESKSRLARGTDGTPGRRARATDRSRDIGFRVILAPTEVPDAGF